MLLSLAAVALLAPSSPTSESVQHVAQEDWRLIDGVAIQADDRVVTLSEFQEFFERKLKDRALTTQAELQREIQGAKSAVITLQLEAQAGENLGIDQNQVDRLIDQSLLDLRRDQGVDKFLDSLEERGQDGLSVKKDESVRLHQSLWREKTTGRPGPSGERPTQDRFVRPGTLRASYKVNRSELEEPDRVRFQVLDLPVAAVGGMDAARTLAEEIRGRALAGEDFGDLVLEFGVTSRETLGVTDFFPVPALLDPELRVFAETAEQGEFSEVQPIIREEKTVGFRIARLEEREVGAEAPPFTDPRIQDYLRRRLLDTWEDGRLTEARERLASNAFVWSSPMLGPPASAADAAPDADAAGTNAPPAPAQGSNAPAGT